MASADEDNFDIDIYGDGEDHPGETPTSGDAAVKGEAEDILIEVGDVAAKDATSSKSDPDTATKTEAGQDSKMGNGGDGTATNGNQKIATADGSSSEQIEIPRQPPQKQGVKRKEGAGTDDRPIDNGATSALLIQDLNWWKTDDDIRGWVNQSRCEDELKDITFSEHKVNGKSKGQAFVEFTTPQAASAVKRKIESFGEGQQYVKKHSVQFTSSPNPYRTLPKDAPPRGGGGARGQNDRPAQGQYSNNSGGANAGGMNFGNNMGGGGGGGYRGGRGGYNNNRGGSMGHMGGYNQNRGGYPNAMMNAGGPQVGFQGAQAVGGFQGAPMGGMQQFGGFNRGGGNMMGMRGGPVGGRGGRGGMGPTPGMMGGGMPNMPNMMGGMMGAGGMPGQMGMMGGAMGGMGMQGTPFSTPLNAGVGVGVQPGGVQPHFNPAFFGAVQGQGSPGGWNAGGGGGGSDGGQGAGGAGGNPHGTKRQRPE